MKILAILGCSKQGNTTEVVRYFEKQLAEQMDCAFEYLYLSDYLTEFCIGCHNCIFVDEKKCPHYLDVAMIESKIMDADGLVMATPGYMFSVTGIMKNFLDHVAYNCHRPKYFHKKVYLIANCTKWQAKSVFTPMETWVGGAGFTLSGKFFVDMMPFPVKEELLNKKRQNIRKEAITFGQSLSKEDELKPKFGDLMMFRVFRTLCGLAPDILNADMKYFKEKDAYSKQTHWYVPAKVSRVKLALANLSEKKMEKEIRKMMDVEALEKVESRHITRL